MTGIVSSGGSNLSIKLSGGSNHFLSGTRKLLTLRGAQLVFIFIFSRTRDVYN